MLQLAATWQTRLAKSAFFAKPAIDDDKVVWGRGTILLAPRAPTGTGDGAAEDRLSALLTVAGGGLPSDGLLLLFKTVAAEWQRGERALAAIRLAFAPVPSLDAERAYRLFLAEQALDAGLDPTTVLREFGLAEAAGFRKYDPDQPRVPAGSGRASGQFGSKPSGAYTATTDDGRTESASSPKQDAATIKPVFYDPRHPDFEAPPIDPLFGGPSRFGKPSLEDGVLNPLPLLLPLLPFVYPRTKAKDDDDGPACPAMRPDRSAIGNPAGDAVETRGALLVNPDDPTPKRPLSAAMAYFLPTPSASGEVEYDDCKRSKVPALIPTMKKGDMAEYKAERAAWLAWQEWAQKKDGAGLKFASQIDRQVTGIRLEHKDRRIFYMVGSQENVDHLSRMYSKTYPEARFVTGP